MMNSKTLRHLVRVWIAGSSMTIISIAWPSASLADLVLEESLRPSVPAASTSQTQAVQDQMGQDRESLRTVLAPSVRQETAVAAPQELAPSLTKTELLRRARMREELKNEDILQERLEELRLREERRLTDQLLGVKANEPQTMQADRVQMKPAVVQTEYIGSTSDQITSSSASAINASVQNAPAQTQDSFKMKDGISLTPRVGIASMLNTQLFNVTSRFSAGAELGVPVAENVTLQLGFQFNQFGIGLAPGNIYVQAAQSVTPIAYTQGYSPYVLNQNVIDASVKVNLLGSTSRFRPYVGGGIGYARSFLNYDPSVIQTVNSLYGNYFNLAQDYVTQSFLGSVQAGIDIAVSSNVLLGINAKYYNVFTAQENQNLNTAAFYNPGFYGYGPTDPTKVFAGGSLARQNFYSITGTASFVF